MDNQVKGHINAPVPAATDRPPASGGPAPGSTAIPPGWAPRPPPGDRGQNDPPWRTHAIQAPDPCRAAAGGVPLSVRSPDAHPVSRHRSDPLWRARRPQIAPAGAASGHFGAGQLVLVAHGASGLPHGGVRGECRSARHPVRGGDSLRSARRSVWRGSAVPCPCSGADGDRAAQHPAPRLRTISYWYGDACRVKSSAYVPLRASSSECVPDSTTDPSRNT
jgi:hypothetical protein